MASNESCFLIFMLLNRGITEGIFQNDRVWLLRLGHKSQCGFTLVFSGITQPVRRQLPCYEDTQATLRRHHMARNCSLLSAASNHSWSTWVHHHQRGSASPRKPSNDCIAAKILTTISQDSLSQKYPVKLLLDV